jgi:hypothetical protein
LRSWLARADVEDGRRPELRSVERVELVRPHREKPVLELQNEIDFETAVPA